MPATTVQPEAGQAARPSGPSRTVGADLRRLLDLEVPVIVQLACRRMRLGEVMSFTPGTIIEFDKPAEEPLDLLVNNVTVARGDVVKVGENFGLRLTQVGQVRQTIQALGRSEPGA